MNQTQLKVFTAAAENRSFTKTAEQLFITQAAVTQHIQALEAAIGCELFDRRKRPMRLTPAGKTFYADAKSLLRQMDSAVMRTKDAASGDSGSLHIGFLKGYERSDLSVAARRFRAAHPNTLLTFERKSSDQLAAGLMQGTYDVIFTWDSTNLRQNPEVSWLQTDRIRLVVAMYSAHPLSGRTQLSRAELRGENIFYIRAEHPLPLVRSGGDPHDGRRGGGHLDPPGVLYEQALGRGQSRVRAAHGREGARGDRRDLEKGQPESPPARMGRRPAKGIKKRRAAKCSAPQLFYWLSAMRISLIVQSLPDRTVLLKLPQLGQ